MIGGGPAGLVAAEMLAANDVSVDLFDAMPSVGRKFLLAGRGGLNLTHSEPAASFLTRYGDASDALRAALSVFGGEEDYNKVRPHSSVGHIPTSPLR